MGRKIPGKKHRGVKDPYSQHRQRFATLKNKINNPPPKGREDEQAIPKSVLNIMKLKERAVKLQKIKNNKCQRKMLLKNGDITTRKENSHRMNFSGQVNTQKKERLNLVAENFHPSTLERQKKFDKFDAKFNVDEIDVNSRKKTKVNAKKKKMKLIEKRKGRELKKVSAKELDKDFPKREKVEFGDIVHRPPMNLTLPCRKGNEAAGRKPGKTDLLLKNMLPFKFDLKDKASLLEKQRRECMRKAAVEAFRIIKKNQRTTA